MTFGRSNGFCLATLWVALALVSGPRVFAADAAQDREAKLDGVFDQLLPKFAIFRGNALRLAVGNFPCANSGAEGMSTVSRIIHDEIAEAITRNARYTLVAREQLEELLEAKQFHTLDFLDPNASIPAVNIDAFDAVIRGSFVYLSRDESTRVTAQLVRLTGGHYEKATISVPLELLGIGKAEALPGETPHAVVARIFPPNVKESESNTESVQGLVKDVPNREIRAEIWVKGGRTDFRDGERAGFTVRADRDCHVAVFGHQVDGSSVVLFPNAFNRSTLVRGDGLVDIPGRGEEGKGGFLIDVQSPFGADVVQVIACTHRSALLKVIADANRAEGAPFATVTRGSIGGRMRGFGVKAKPGDGDGPIAGDPPGPCLWGEARVTVKTYPRR